jgi:Zn-dependent M16 (insulinase) family peptidase
MKNSELERLRDKCLFYTQFLIQKLSDSPELIKGLEETYRLVEKAYQDEKIKPLKAMSAEIDDQVICHMPLSMAVEFKNLIKEKLKINYDDVDKAHMKVVERILKKEKISNGEEYKLIVNRIDEIFADINKAEELKKLNKLLLEYENQNKI